jgi:hypothetical protein
MKKRRKKHKALQSFLFKKSCELSLPSNRDKYNCIIAGEDHKTYSYMLYNVYAVSNSPLSLHWQIQWQVVCRI